jgi:hypothetical protein
MFCQDLAKSSSGHCLFVCATLRIVLNFHNNLLRSHLFRGRDPADWRNMGGSSRAVFVVSNPETRPPLPWSSPMTLPPSHHSDDPDPGNLSPSRRLGSQVKATSQAGRPFRSLSLCDSSRFSVVEERVCRRSQLPGMECVSEGREWEKGRGPDKGAVCRRGRPMASKIGFQEG